MPTLEFVPPEGSPDPCPNACGGLIEDPYGGPCKACWSRVDRAEADFWDDENDLGGQECPSTCPRFGVVTRATARRITRTVAATNGGSGTTTLPATTLRATA